MSVKKTLCTLVMATSISLGTSLFSGCDNAATQEKLREQQAQLQIAKEENERKIRLEQIAAQKQIEHLYNSSQIIAKYSVPFVEIKSKKISLTLDLFTHIANEAKAQTIRLPVSEKYFSSITVGQELESTFNTGALLFRGDLEGYEVRISDKTRNDIYFVKTANEWGSINSSQYQKLVELNNQLHEYSQSNQQEIFTRTNLSDVQKKESEETCRIIIESEKTNITLDIFKHLENEWNKMRYPIEVPRFLGDKLEVGTAIDQNFVGASLFFSRSPSIVTYNVLEKNCD